MMNSQFYAGRSSRLPALLTTRWAEPVRLRGRGGELRVRSGAVWLTRVGDADDRVLHAGQRLRLRPGDDAVFEQWQRDVPAIVEWQSARPAGLSRWLRAVGARARWALAGAAAPAAPGPAK
jgi:hypothetical protein